MPYHDFECSPSNFFEKKKNNNLNKWEQIEKKREQDLQKFLNICSNNNAEVLQKTSPQQHEMINKN